MKSWIAAAALVATFAASPARANSYNVTFNGAISFFDVFVTIDTGAYVGGGGYDVTSVTGTDTSTVDGGPYSLTLVTAAGTPPNSTDNGTWIFDDVFYPSGSPYYVDNSGLLFTDSNGNTLNLYSTGSGLSTAYYLSVDTPSSLYNPGDPGIITGVTETATPLPSTWTMLIAGFFGFGFLAYRGSKRHSAALSAV